MRGFSQGADVLGKTVLGAIPQSDSVNAAVLAAGTPKTLAVPTGASLVLFSGSDDFHARIDGEAAVPSGDIPGPGGAAGSACELNPTLRKLNGATSVGLAAPRACTVTLAFYA